MILCLDLSSKCSGWSKFSRDGKLMDKGRITPSPEINSLMKIHYLVGKIEQLYTGVDELVIEDIFLNTRFANVDVLKYLARISGAVIFSWINEKYKIPHFYMANRARPLAGIKGNSHKAEVQLFVAQKYGYGTPDEREKYEYMILQMVTQHKAKDIKTSKFKYRMGKISELIDVEIGIGEDTADSIILGLAYVKENS